MTEAAARLRVHGRVQGVGYRDWARARGAALGLRGWVRNRIDGTVEILAAGPAESVDAMAEACRVGPAHSRVERVEREPAQGIVGDAGFVRKPTV